LAVIAWSLTQSGIQNSTRFISLLAAQASRPPQDGFAVANLRGQPGVLAWLINETAGKLPAGRTEKISVLRFNRSGVD
jgi:hypothetical protein